MKRKSYFALLAALALCSLSSTVGAGPTHSGETTMPQGVDFWVNSSADDASAHDWLPGDGICADTLGRCTLRAAIEEANDWPGVDTIYFASSMDINLDTTEGALPPITEQLMISAISVWDLANDRPGVTLNGDNKDLSGLTLSAGYCVVRGLFLTNFRDAIDIQSAYNTIGGPALGQRNVISGNQDGIVIHGPSAHHNVVMGNWIGVSLTGDGKLPNFLGVSIEGGAHENTLGGDALSLGNHISGNSYHGVLIRDANSDGNRLGGNRIGLPAVGAQDVGNDWSGVVISTGPRNTHVGSDAGDLAANGIAFNGDAGVDIRDADNNSVEANSIIWNKNYGVLITSGSAGNQIQFNEIAYNTLDGVAVGGATSIGNTILANRIHHNGRKGIALLDGGNSELAAPTITTASASGASGTGCAWCTIHLYSDSAGEGETYHGFTDVDGSGNWSYSGVLTGPNVTATNTGSCGQRDDGAAPTSAHIASVTSCGDTSEFSAPFAIGSGESGTCTNPLPISCGQQLSGDTTGHASNHNTYSCSSWQETGPEVIYQFTLPAGATYDITTALSDLVQDLDIFLLSAAGCDAGQCLGGGTSGNSDITVINMPAGTYFIAVDGFDGAAGSYKLSLTCAPNGGMDHRIFLPLVAR